MVICQCIRAVVNVRSLVILGVIGLSSIANAWTNCVQISTTEIECSGTDHGYGTAIVPIPPFTESSFPFNPKTTQGNDYITVLSDTSLTGEYIAMALMQTGNGDDEVTIGNSATLDYSEAGYNGQAFGILLGNGNNTFTNFGSLISETSVNELYGLRAGSGNTEITNYGDIRAQYSHNGSYNSNLTVAVDLGRNANFSYNTNPNVLNEVCPGQYIVRNLENALIRASSEAEDPGTIVTYDLNPSAQAIGIRAEIEESREAQIINDGTLDVMVEATADPGSIVPLVYPRGTATANADGVLARGGSAKITNSETGTVQVTSIAYADANHETYGSTEVDAIISSSSISGIETGSADDIVLNSGNMEIRFEANAESDAVALGVCAPCVPIFVPAARSGEAISKIEASSVYAINAGDGNNQVLNEGDIYITIDSRAEADTVVAAPITINCDATAVNGKHFGELEVYGISTGDGQNVIKNSGRVELMVEKLRAEADATGDTDADSIAEVAGIFYGIYTAGRSDILNDKDGFISIQATATADADSNSVISASTQATSNVSAVGIRAAGYIPNNSALTYNEITNLGTISVQAESIAINRSGSGSSEANASAVGVYGSASDDVIKNYGAIRAVKSDDSGLVSGKAIFVPSGNNHILLGEKSWNYGSISLGINRDTLLVEGGAVVIGVINGGLGEDTLTVQRRGEISTDVLGFERVIKQGTGTFRIEDLPSANHLEVDEGVLTLGNSYAMPAGAQFHVRVNPDGSDNRLNVETGMLSLEGDLYVTHSPGLFLDGDTFEVITAPSIEETFINKNLPDPIPLLTFSLKQESNLVEVVAAAKSFTSVAKNRVEQAVGSYMNAVAPSATGDLWNVLGEFQQLPESDFETGFSSLSPGSYDNFTLSTYRVVREYSHGIRQRLADTRKSGRDEGDRNITGFHQVVPLLIVFNGTDSELQRLFKGVSEQASHSKQGVWVDAYGLRGDQDGEHRDNWSDGGYQGFDFKTYGVTLGYDQRLTDQWMTGLSFGYAKTDVDLDSNAGNGEIDSKMVSLYGEYQSGSNYLDAIVTYGKSDYDNKRNVKIGSIERTARSDHDGDIFSVAIEGGRAILRERTRLEPFMSLQYTHLDEDDFVEAGAGGISLNIDGEKTDSLVSQVGIRASTDIDWNNGRLITDAGLAWVHDFDIDDRVITASYAGAPQTAFSVKGRDIARNGASLDFGVLYQTKSNLTASIRVGAEVRDNYHDERIIGQLQYRF